MPKLIVFTEVGFSGSSQEFTTNDPGLTLNGDANRGGKAAFDIKSKNMVDTLTDYRITI